MDLRREVFVSVGSLLAFSLLLAFGSIGLLGRMGPAIDRILTENVPSMQAGQEMLLVMAQSGGRPASPEERQRFMAALATAKDRASLREEQPLLHALEQSAPAALDGDPSARAGVASRATRLVALNYAAMQATDGRAKRLGAAGAWISVFIAALSCLLGFVVLRRLNTRIVTPLEDLTDVVQASSRGDRFRRCRPFSGPKELARTFEAINELLDERLMRDAGHSIRPRA